MSMARKSHTKVKAAPKKAPKKDRPKKAAPKKEPKKEPKREQPKAVPPAKIVRGGSKNDKPKTVRDEPPKEVRKAPAPKKEKSAGRLEIVKNLIIGNTRHLIWARDGERHELTLPATDDYMKAIQES